MGRRELFSGAGPRSIPRSPARFPRRNPRSDVDNPPNGRCLFGAAQEHFDPGRKSHVAPLEHDSPPAGAAGSAGTFGQSRWSVRRWVWMSGLASIAAFALGGVYGVPAATSSPDYGATALVRVHVPPTTTTTTASTTTTTTVPAAAPAPAPAPAPTPAPAPAVLAATPAAPPAAPALPSYGHATVWGCTAALAYLQAYAAPGFALDCPGYA
jgi:hypothetical protein